MVASDGKLAREVLNYLGTTGLRASIMEPAAEISGAALQSDVDLIVDRHPVQVLQYLAQGLPDLKLLLVSHYDVGGFAVWATDPTAVRPLQLDMLYDPKGSGRLGLKTDALLPVSGVENEANLTSEARALYYLMKGAWKAQKSRVRAAKSQVDRVPDHALDELLERHLARRVRPQAVAMLRGESVPELPTVHLGQIPRILERLLQPAGACIALAPSGQVTALEVCRRMAPLVRGVHIVRGPLVRAKASVLVRRPELVLTLGTGEADMTAGDDVDALAEAITLVLDSRMRKRLQKAGP